MPVYTILPDSLAYDDALWVLTGTTKLGAVNDASDATYLHAVAGDYIDADAEECFNLANPSSPAGVFVALCPGARWKSAGASSPWPSAEIGWWATGFHSTSPLTKVDAPYSASIIETELPAYLGLHSLATFPGQSVNAAGMQARSRGAGMYLYRLWAKAYYLAAATVAAPSAPTGTITNMQKPPCTVTVSAVVESWQKPSGVDPWLTGGDVEYRIYHSADAPGASPPATPAPVWSSFARFALTTYGDGVTPSTIDVTATPDVALDSGTYRVYTRASRDLPAGTRAYWSGWSHADFTITTSSPTAPDFSLAADSPNQRVGATVYVHATSGFDSASACVDVQRSTPDGWREVRGMTALPVATGSNVLAGYDQEADRGVTNTYRARASMLSSGDGSRWYSAWTTATVTGPALAGWNLKALELPAASWIGAPVLTGPAETWQGAVGVFTPVDRARPVTVAGEVGGAGGTYEILASGSAAIASLQALIDYGGLILAESAFGDSKYVSVTAAGWTREGTPSAPRRSASLTYVEVDAGLAVTP